MPNTIVLAVIGAVTGYMAGFLGAGGGFLTVILFIAAGVPVHDSVGTSLVFTIVVGIWGTILHLRQQTGDVPLALSLGLPSFVTAVLGAQLADVLSERTLTLAFGGLTGFVFVALWLQPRIAILRKRAAATIQHKHVPEAHSSHAVWKEDAFIPSPRSVSIAAMGGAVIGVLKGLFGVGGGFLLMPFMLLFLGVGPHIAVGSSLFAILLGSIAGGIRHATLGNVDFMVFLYAIPGGVIGSYFGTRATAAASGPLIRRIFMAVMVASTVYLVATGL